VIHRIRVLHKEIYALGQALPKRDKLGVHAVVENLCVEILAHAVKAAFQSRQTKLGTLEFLRVKIEVLKHLVRTEQELGVLKEKTYLHLAGQMVEISKMTNGWIAYTQKGA
jgi:hypothetical protein